MSSNADQQVHAAVEGAFRTAHGRLVGALIRRLGTQHIDLVENTVQDALLRALERWPADGVPDNAAGWLFRTAYHGAIDALRREAHLRAIAGALPTGAAEPEPSASLGDELPLMFLCCHPALPRAAQIALTLKLTCGFTVAQIAHAFLSEETTVAQRLVRAKRILRDTGATLELPDDHDVPARLDPLLDVLYLVFNEGHAPSGGDAGVDDELCGEALRLVGLLTGFGPTATPAAEALHALLCFQSSRLAARRADDGSLLLLAEQDRGRWDRSLIAAGFLHLQRAARGPLVSRFHIEAGIAACHAQAPRHDATDWPQVLYLYDALRACAPSPVVDVNRALAVAMVRGTVAGLDELDAIPERAVVDRYPYALAAYAELHAARGAVDQAVAYLRRAIALQPSQAQRSVLDRKLRALSG